MSREDVRKLLEDRGITATLQRIEMAWLLLKKNQHLTADEVNRLINGRFPKVSRATIFNNLNLFVESGLLKKLELKSGVSVYDSNTSAHHHVINPESGEILDIELDEHSTRDLQASFKEFLKINKGLDLQIDDIQIVVRGSLAPSL